VNGLVDGNGATNQKISVLVLALWCGRIEAEHVGIVRKAITGGVSARWNGGTMCRRKKESIYLKSFLYHLLLEGGKKICATLVSNGLLARGRK
jgi:hypothetical protein